MTSSASTLTGLIPVIYAAWNQVSRELCGFIPAVDIDASAARAAKDETVRSVLTSAEAAGDVAPDVNAPDDGDTTAEYVDLTISKSRRVPIRFQGEEEAGIANQGPGMYQNYLQGRFAEGMRTLINELEVDVAKAAYKGASRAAGAAGTTPFQSSLAEAADVRKILADNGCPMNGGPGSLSLVVDTAAGTYLRKLAQLMNANTAGTDQTLRQGLLLPIMGFDMKESAGVASHTKGAGTGYDLTSAGAAVGDTTLPLEGGTVNTTGIVAGDVVTFSGGTADANKYVVNTGLVATSGNIVIGRPGVKILKVDADEMTIGNNYTANVAFHRSAIKLVTRAPKRPSAGDAAIDVMTITDPLTGITLEISAYPQYRQIYYEVALAWGVKAVKSAWIAVLMG